MDVVDRVVEHVRRTDSGGALGLYLCGSAVAGGLRLESDIDLLMLTRRSLVADERRELVDLLLRYSGRRASVTPGRPVEVISLVVADVVPWRYPPTCDLQYGEWLRDDFAAGALPKRHSAPDLAVVLTAALGQAQAIWGPPLVDVVAPVPPEHLARAVQDALDPLRAGLLGDERNVLLTLARMVVTAESGQIVSKDQAAERVAPRLADQARSVLLLASAGYLGETTDVWGGHRSAVTADTADQLADLIRARRG